MAITFVAAGTATTGNNASVTPGAITGVAVGDLVLIQASIRNTGTGTVNTPTGWGVIAAIGSHKVIGRFWQTGDSMPLISFTGGVANADTMAQGLALRGCSPDALTSGVVATQTNTSAQNIAFPALNVPGDNFAVIIAAWKQDDATTYSTPSSHTAVGVVNSTAGDDASQQLYYRIETTEADIGAGSLTVTGGASAVSSAILFTVHPAASLAVTTQVVYPSRVLVSLTGLVAGYDTVALYRSVDSVETLLRAGTANPTADTSFLTVDAELPFGVPVTYVAYVNGSARYATGATTYTLAGGKVALTDAVTGLAVETVIFAWDEIDRDRSASVFRVGGRNVVVMSDLGQYEADITFFFDTDDGNAQMTELLENATEGTVQIRQPGGYVDVDSYAAITTAKITRFSQDGSDPRRTWTVHAVQVDGWAPSLAATGWTLQDIYDHYGATATLQDLSNDYATLLAVAQADWSS
jgi:hypothetical protein